MGVLFNRSRVPHLVPMMLDQISRFNLLLDNLRLKGPIDLVPTCRALEADIVCKFSPAAGNLELADVKIPQRSSHLEVRLEQLSPCLWVKSWT